MHRKLKLGCPNISETFLETTTTTIKANVGQRCFLWANLDLFLLSSHGTNYCYGTHLCLVLASLPPLKKTDKKRWKPYCRKNLLGFIFKIAQWISFMIIFWHENVIFIRCVWPIGKSANSCTLETTNYLLLEQTISKASFTDSWHWKEIKAFTKMSFETFPLMQSFIILKFRCISLSYWILPLFAFWHWKCSCF